MITLFIYTINFTLLFLVVYWLYRYDNAHPLRRLFLPLLVLKLLAGMGLGLVFLWYYQVGDTLTYFEEACRYADLAQKDFMLYLRELWNDNVSSFQSIYHRQPRALLMTKITSVFALITGQNYWLTSLYFSLFSFVGIWWLAAQVYSVYQNKLAIILSLFVFPSVLFWTAGISKESLSLAFLALSAGVFLKYMTNKQSLHYQHGALFLVSVWLLWEIKYYYAAVFILIVLATKIAQWITRLNKSGVKFYHQAMVFFSACIIMSLIISLAHPNFYLDRVAAVIVQNHDAFIAKSNPESVIHFYDLEASGWSLLVNSPLALISGLFRPWIFDGVGWLNGLAILENLSLVLLTLTALPSIVKIKSRETKLLVLAASIYCILLAIFLALSTPNFGTLVRYKTGFLPIFLLLITLDNIWIKKINYWLFKD